MTESPARQAILRHFVTSAFAHHKPSRVAVAVSGGGDSMALLCVMAEWAKSEKIPLFAVTVNHGLRDEAAHEAAFVAETCQRLQVNHTTLDWTGWQGEGNLQDAARRARYDLMAEWSKGLGISQIALAHTCDDQAETFFMRLARASGIDGLTGMQRRRTDQGITWVRPFLMAARDDLRSYLRDIHQPWIDDPTNDDERFDRIKARRAMEALAPLGVDADVVGRVMDHLAQVRTALDYASHDHALECMRMDHGDLIVDRRRFAEAAPEITRRLMSSALRWIASADYGPRGLALQEFISSALRGRDATLHGVRLIAGTEQFRLTREYDAVRDTTSAAVDLWDNRWRVKNNENQSLVIRALGEDGLAQVAERPPNAPPRPALMSSPALFDGPTLVASPILGLGSHEIVLDVGKDDVFTTLLCH
ncbi:tRNA lysidine(34) synthetase TilS [Celeribacter arenosi]|uniref:tRNA(Ile)-lysidine synthase n=1 Tax=Celeribacter arenosi TaxID=792649 RepID=A0ABP7K8N7_9RHOB